MNKPPAFQFYPQDYLSSSRVAEMTLEEEGVYIRLLCYCWSTGSIPADPERCAKLAGKGCSIETATNVQRAFNVRSTDGQRLLHDRLEIERDKQNKNRLLASQAGKRSGEVRSGRVATPCEQTTSNGRSTDVEHPLNSSSSSSSSSSEDSKADNGHSANADALIWQSEILKAFDSAFGCKSRLTTSRKKHLNARWKDEHWREHWREALERGAKSEFLKGNNGKGWRIDFEFFCRPDTVTKILEGKYDNRENSNGHTNGHSGGYSPDWMTVVKVVRANPTGSDTDKRARKAALTPELFEAMRRTGSGDIANMNSYSQKTVQELFESHLADIRKAANGTP